MTARTLVLIEIARAGLEREHRGRAGSRLDSRRFPGRNALEIRASETLRHLPPHPEAVL